MSETPSSPQAEILREDVGTWDARVEVKVPGAPPQISRGRLVARMIGPWLVSDFANETTGFEGRGVYGWDAAKGAYVGTWVDPMRRSLVVMDGTWNPATRTMTYVGTMQRADGAKMRWREATERVDADTHLFRSYVPTPSGEEQEIMTVTYTRVREKDA